jgi:hypothetical protein
MKCFANWNKYTIKQQLLSSYGISVLLSLLIIYSLLISYIFVLSNQIIKISENDLYYEIMKNTKSLSDDNSELFVETMHKNSKGFLYPYLRSAEISLETNFNLNKIRGYMKYGDDELAKPLSFDQRHNKFVSLKHSAFTVPYLRPDNQSNLPQNIINIINYTMNSDSYIITSYLNYKDFVSGYMGYNKGGLFLQYPGTNTLTTDPQRIYDPRNRGWYNMAIRTDGAIYTDPYLDFSGKGWMITIAKTIKNNNNDYIGVAGSDMLINVIKQNIEKIRILESGKASLFTSSGIVIADQEWDATLNSQIYTYRNLTNPKINHNNWISITSNNNTELTVDNYYLISKKIRLSQQIFFLVLTIPQNKILEPVKNITNSIESSQKSTIIIITIVTLLIIVITIIITLYMGNNISNSIKELCNNSQKIMENLGKDNLYEGVNEIKNNGQYDEVYQLQNQYNTMLGELKQDSKIINNDNPFYNNPDYFKQDDNFIEIEHTYREPAYTPSHV